MLSSFIHLFVVLNMLLEDIEDILKSNVFIINVTDIKQNNIFNDFFIFMIFCFSYSMNLAMTSGNENVCDLHVKEIFCFIFFICFLHKI